MRVGCITACKRKDGRKDEYPDGQDLTERPHDSFGPCDRKENEITDADQDSGGNQTEEEVHTITSKNRSHQADTRAQEIRAALKTSDVQAFVLASASLSGLPFRRNDAQMDTQVPGTDARM